MISSETIPEIYLVIRDALRVEWDPIGVGHIPEALDEYDSYVPLIYNLIAGDDDRDQIVNSLWWLETEQIGMPGNREGVERFADRLLDLRTTLRLKA